MSHQFITVFPIYFKMVLHIECMNFRDDSLPTWPLQNCVWDISNNGCWASQTLLFEVTSSWDSISPECSFSESCLKSGLTYDSFTGSSWLIIFYFYFIHVPLDWSGQNPIGPFCRKKFNEPQRRLIATAVMPVTSHRGFRFCWAKLMQRKPCYVAKSASYTQQATLFVNVSVAHQSEGCPSLWVYTQEPLLLHSTLRIETLCII